MTQEPPLPTAPAKPLDRDPARSPTLPGGYYADPTVFAAERDRIFFRHWQLVGHVSELAEPGSYVCAQIVDQNVFVIRGRDGALRGFYNVCQHRAHELLRGRGQVGSVIVCPYHAWSYETDGTLRMARFCQALPDFEKAEFGLVPVRLEVQLGFVFVNLDPEAVPLADLAGDMFEDMRSTLPWVEELEVTPEDGADRADADGWDGVELAANWKVLAENCLECYHCGPAHPALVDLVDMTSYACEPRGTWLRSSGKLNKTQNKAYDVSRDEPMQEAVFWHLWPNVEFGQLPGEAALGAFRFYPTGPETTRTTGLTLTRPGERIREERLTYRWTVLWPEDESLCRSVHRGLKSRGYRQGRFMVDPERMAISEHGVHSFQLLYAEAMGLPEAPERS